MSLFRILRQLGCNCDETPLMGAGCVENMGTVNADSN